MGGGIETVGVVGVGPVGCILGTHLGNAGAEIVVTDIPRRLAQVREKGLKVCFGEKSWSTAPARWTPSPTCGRRPSAG